MALVLIRLYLWLVSLLIVVSIIEFEKTSQDPLLVLREGSLAIALLLF